MAGWILTIDYGTTYTTGAIRSGDRIEVIEIDRSKWVPSTVLLDEDGHLVAGGSAERQAALYPGRVERTPKRHLGETTPLLLGGNPVAVVDAVAAVLRLVAGETVRRQGGRPPEEVRLTYPARWRGPRQQALADAAHSAGLRNLVLIPEPVAAAAHFGSQLPVGADVAVYDLGGGTFDTAVLTRTPDGFIVLGQPGGIDDLGGEDFDHALYQRLGDMLGEIEPNAWELLQTSTERVWRTAAADLLKQVRAAKESLSYDPVTTVYVPSPVDRDFRLSRAQLEETLRPFIERTAAELDRSIRSADRDPQQLAGVYLAGGSSRIPLVSTLVAARLQRTPAVLDEPKIAIASGAAVADGMGRRLAEPEDESKREEEEEEEAASDGPILEPSNEAGDRRRLRTTVIAAAAVLLLAGIAIVVAVVIGDNPPAKPSIAAPGNLRAQVSGGAVTLSWATVPAAQSYRLYRDSEQITDITGTSYIDELPDTEPHIYYVRAVDSAGQAGGASSRVNGQIEPSPSPTSTLTPKQQDLFNRLPQAVVDCVPYPDGERGGASAAIECGVNASVTSANTTSVTLFFELYESMDATKNAFNRSIDSRLPQASCAATLKPGQGKWSDFGGSGLLACETYKGYSYVEWTYTTKPILASAQAKGDEQGDLEGLIEWWNDSHDELS